MKELLGRSGVSSLLLLAISLYGCGGGGGGGGGGGTSDTAAATSQEAPSEALSSSPYEVQLLGPSGSDSYAVAVNASGQVAGNYKGSDGVQHLVRWSGGTMSLLADSAQATDLNDNGDVVGWLIDEDGTEAFIYTDQLYLFNLPEGSSRAYAVDSEGRVAGRYTGATEQAFLDENGTAVMLAPDLDAYAIAMNDAGQILLKELRADGFHTLLSQTDGSLVDLGNLGGASTQAMDINESGQVVGWSQTADGKYQAFSWKDGVMTALAEPGWTYSSAVAVDASGNILIKATVGTEKGVFLLKDGALVDLERLGMDYVEVSDMNDQGQIVGWTVTETGNFQAFLATPFESDL